MSIPYVVSDARPIVAALRGLGVPRGAAAKLAAAYPGGRGLAAAPPPVLRHAAGVAGQKVPAWTGRIAAAFSLAAAVGIQARDGDGRVGCPREAAERVRRLLHDQTQECFVVVMLDCRQAVIDVAIVHRGTVSQVDVHPRGVFRPAVQCGAHSIVVAHNHPSGNPEPSPADLTLTARLLEVGSLVGILVVDHIVTAGDRYVSMAARGMLESLATGGK